MDHFKSDFLKVLMLFIIVFSFTNGDQQAFKSCKRGMNLVFDLSDSLLECVVLVLTTYRNELLPYGDKQYANLYTKYAKDVNDYYWDMHNLVSAEGIELPEHFCERLEDPLIKYALAVNLNETDCKTALKSFENVIPGALIGDMDPTDSQEIRDYKLRKRVLYNALYLHANGRDRNSPYIHPEGTYGAVYLDTIGGQLKLINDNDITPVEFCKQRHKIDKKDEGPSI